MRSGMILGSLSCPGTPAELAISPQGETLVKKKQADFRRLVFRVAADIGRYEQAGAEAFRLGGNRSEGSADEASAEQQGEEAEGGFRCKGRLRIDLMGGGC
jgi:hypothetical protein